MSASFWFMVAVVSTAGMSFVVVLAWLADRTKQREEQYAHYRDETVRKMAESGDTEGALAYMRELEHAKDERSRNAMLLGGLVTIAAGMALMIFLYALIGAAIYLVGLIPIFVGLSLLIYTQFMLKPKQ